MTTLRAEMVKRMRLHRLAPKTQVAYVCCVASPQARLVASTLARKPLGVRCSGVPFRRHPQGSWNGTAERGGALPHAPGFSEAWPSGVRWAGHKQEAP